MAYKIQISNVSVANGVTVVVGFPFLGHFKIRQKVFI